MLWRTADKGEQAVVYAGVPEAKHKAETDFHKADGYIPATVQALAGGNGAVRYSGVWWKGPGNAPVWNLRWGDSEPAYDDRVFAGEQLLLDAHFGPAMVTAEQVAWAAGLTATPRSLVALALPVTYRSRHYASVWRDDSTREAVGLHGLSPERHLARCRDLAAQGYRPVALSLGKMAGEKDALAASVWHLPALPVAEADRLAKWQGVAGATLMALGQPEAIWPLWKHRSDPTVRSHLVEQAGLRGADPQVLIQRLDEEKDISARRR